MAITLCTPSYRPPTGAGSIWRWLDAVGIHLFKGKPEFPEGLYIGKNVMQDIDGKRALVEEPIHISREMADVLRKLTDNYKKKQAAEAAEKGGAKK